MNPIEPIQSGTFTTLLGIEKGNEIIGVANAINGLTGLGQVQVLQADAGLRASFQPGTPLTTDDSAIVQTDAPP